MPEDLIGVVTRTAVGKHVLSHGHDSPQVTCEGSVAQWRPESMNLLAGFWTDDSRLEGAWCSGSGILVPGVLGLAHSESVVVVAKIKWLRCFFQRPSRGGQADSEQTAGVTFHGHWIQPNHMCHMAGTDSPERWDTGHSGLLGVLVVPRRASVTATQRGLAKRTRVLSEGVLPVLRCGGSVSRVGLWPRRCVEGGIWMRDGWPGA